MAGENIYVTVSRTDPAVNVFAAVFQLNAQGFGSWEGWFVLLPFDQLYLASDTGDVSYWLSGALLPGTAS